MRTLSILAGAAIALATTVGSASAGEQFTYLAGFEAQAMTKLEMGEVRGAAILTVVLGRSVIEVEIPDGVGDALAITRDEVCQGDFCVVQMPRGLPSTLFVTYQPGGV